MTTELRLRTRISASALEERVGKILTAGDADIRLTGPAKVLKPDGRPLAVYLPGALREEMSAAYPTLHTIRTPTKNRGTATGTETRVVQRNQNYGKPVVSSILGSFEASGYYKFCRLTSWTAKEVDDRWPQVWPLLQRIGQLFADNVPDRHEAQMRYVRATQPAWVIRDTPFTTITVNNTWPTAVHQDAGDLDEGFSCLAVARRGDYTGGYLTLPEYRVNVDLQDGDLLLMDAHDWHGNTKLVCACGIDPSARRAERRGPGGPCPECGAERISLVCYFRTKMKACGSAAEEQAKMEAWAQRVSLPEQVVA